MNQTKNDSARDGGLSSASTALLIVDVINDLEFEDGEQLLEFALPAAEKLRELKRRFRDKKLPVIYANDNFGRWKSDFNAQVQHCLGDNVRGKPIVEILAPDPEDYFVLKPKHSAFYGTTLQILLQGLEIQTLVITGFATDICVLFTANDAYMRDYNICIPCDCVAANTAQKSESALELMRDVLKADTRPSIDQGAAG